MDRRFWIVLIAGIGLSGLSSVYAEVKSEYAVSEVLKVRSLSAFDCKIAGYTYAPSARFRVQIRGVVINPQIPAEGAVEYLYERLKNAERIVLKKIQFRNYFRLVADVSVDGRNLGRELIQQKLVLPEPPTDNSDAPAPTASNNTVPGRYRPAARQSAAGAGQVEKTGSRRHNAEFVRHRSGSFDD